MRRIEKSKRDTKQTLVARRTLSGNYTPPEEAKKEKADAKRKETPANVSNVSRTARS